MGNDFLLLDYFGLGVVVGHGLALFAWLMLERRRRR